jgi:hypothetical protein
MSAEATMPQNIRAAATGRWHDDTRPLTAELQHSASRLHAVILSFDCQQGAIALQRTRLLRHVSAQQSYCQSHCQSQAARKPHPQFVLLSKVCTLLCSRWAPEQAALKLAGRFPKGHRLCVSNETIYNCIYAHPVAIC